MQPSTYAIPLDMPGRLYVMAKPSPDWLQEDIAAWRLMGLDRIVSLLTPGEEQEMGLAAEAEFCRSQGLDFLSFPIPDRGLAALRHPRPADPGRTSCRKSGRHSLPRRDRTLRHAGLLHPERPRRERGDGHRPRQPCPRRAGAGHRRAGRVYPWLPDRLKAACFPRQSCFHEHDQQSVPPGLSATRGFTSPRPAGARDGWHRRN
jgi:hypothetical protein